LTSNDAYILSFNFPLKKNGVQSNKLEQSSNVIGDVIFCQTQRIVIIRPTGSNTLAGTSTMLFY